MKSRSDGDAVIAAFLLLVMVDLFLFPLLGDGKVAILYVVLKIVCGVWILHELVERN